MTKKELNKELRKAICERNVEDAEQLLASGADPNFKLPEEHYREWENYRHQPYSPLRLVVFIISDALIGKEELEKDAEVATLLIAHGADVPSAIELSELRYGSLDREAAQTPFTKVLRVLYDSTS